MYRHTIPFRLLHEIFGDEGQVETFAISTALRKLYSIVAFTLVGFVVDRALPPSRRAAARAAAIVGSFSLLIEIGQTLGGSGESIFVHLFDIGCGAFGGWLAVTLFGRRRPS